MLYTIAQLTAVSKLTTAELVLVGVKSGYENMNAVSSKFLGINENAKAVYEIEYKDYESDRTAAAVAYVYVSVNAPKSDYTLDY